MIPGIHSPGRVGRKVVGLILSSTSLNVTAVKLGLGTDELDHGLEVHERRGLSSIKTHLHVNLGRILE